MPIAHPRRLDRGWQRVAAVVGCLAGATAGVHAYDDALADTLQRATARVEEFLVRAQSLVCTEKVFVQYLDAGLNRGNPGRTIESELRLSWPPDDDGGNTEAQARRRVLKVNGRTPRENDRNNCTTPERHETSPQPLALLLSSERHKYTFAMGRPGRQGGRPAVIVDFKEVAKATGEVISNDADGDCLTLNFDGGTRGRLWLDAETMEVLRMDQHLTYVTLKMPEVLRRRLGGGTDAMLDRYDTSITFKRVTFTEPDEALLLPSTTTTLMITRGSANFRQRTTTTYSGYKRFVTGGRIVPGA